MQLFDLKHKEIEIEIMCDIRYDKGTKSRKICPLHCKASKVNSAITKNYITASYM